MSFLWYSFVTQLHLRVKSIRGWIIVLMLPLLTVSAMRLLPASEVSAPVRVGVALPEAGGEEFWTLLQEDSGTVITYIASDSDTIEKMVATAQWDCGLILDEEFEACLNSLDTDRMFTLLISEGSTVYPLVRESVAACVAELINDEIAEKYLLDTGIIDGELPELVRFRLEEVLAEGERVTVSMRTLSGSELDALTLADAGVNAVLRWMISAVLLVWLLLAAADLGRWAQSPAVRRIGAVRSKTVLLLSRAAGDGLLAIIAGSASMLILGEGWRGCAAVAAYVLLWGSLAVVLGHFNAVWSALPVITPFVPVLSLLLSSVIADIGLFLPSLSGFARWLPVSLFLRCCAGELGALLILIGMSFGCIFCSVLIDRISTKKPA